MFQRVFILTCILFFFVAAESQNCEKEILENQRLQKENRKLKEIINELSKNCLSEAVENFDQCRIAMRLPLKNELETQQLRKVNSSQSCVKVNNLRQKNL